MQQKAWLVTAVTLAGILVASRPALPQEAEPHSITELRRFGKPIPGHDGIVTSIAFSPDGRTIAIARWNLGVELCELDTGDSLLQFPVPHEVPNSLAFTPDGQALATCGDHGVHVWQVSSGGELRRGAHYLTSVMEVSPDGRWLASGCQDGHVMLWDVEALSPIRLGSHREGSWGVAFSPDSALLASVGGDSVVVWDVAKHTRVTTLKEETRGVLAGVAFSPHGDILATTCGQVTFWGLPRGEKLTEVFLRREREEGIHIDSGSGDRLKFTPDGALAVAYVGEVVSFVDPGAGTVVARAPARGRTTSMELSADGRLLATGTWDGLVYVWRVTDILRPGLPGEATPLDEAWAALSASDATTSYCAFLEFQGGGETAAEFLAAKAIQVPEAPSWPRQLLAQLDDDEAAKRDEAVEELCRMGPPVIAALLEALDGGLSPEAVQRIEAALVRIETPTLHVEGRWARGVRVAQALAALGGTTARGALERVAGGAAGAPETEAARRALDAMR